MAGIDKRLRALERKSVRRIDTLADFVLWHAKGCPEQYLIEWNPELLAALEGLLDSTELHRG